MSGATIGVNFGGGGGGGGEQCEESIKLLECELASKITGTRASCSVERREQSQYKIPAHHQGLGETPTPHHNTSEESPWREISEPTILKFSLFP